MDHKSWPWKKKSAEKTVVEANKVSLSEKGNPEEKLQSENAMWESELRSVQDKLSLALAECDAKDKLVKDHEKKAQEAFSVLEKAEGEKVDLKKKLDEALRERVASEERLAHLDGALRECRQQLSFVREEQEQRIHDTVVKTSEEYEKYRFKLEEKLMEMNKRLEQAASENARLSEALVEKDKIVEDLNRQRDRAESDVTALVARLESNEKDNDSLKYEIHVLEKEVEIWNEEREFNRRTAEASRKQHQENLRKISKLESECQRLRLMVRKRLPGPAALAKMKNEVEMLGKDSIVMGRRKASTSLSGLPADGVMDGFSDSVIIRDDTLSERLYAMEEENKTLKEALSKKKNELQFSRSMYARTASKLLEIESQLEESSKSQTNMGPARSEFSVASVSDIDNDDKVSCANSWASALISELEHFKNKKQNGSVSAKPAGASEIDLMDDFAEMEKLALGSSIEANEIVDSMETRSNGNSSEIVSREMVPTSDTQTNFFLSSPETKSKSSTRLPSWLHDIITAILEQQRLTERNPDEILEDIRQALSSINTKKPSHSLLGVDCEGSGVTDVKGSFITSERSVMTNANEADTETQLAKNSHQSDSDLVKSLRVIIELIEGINLHSQLRGASETHTGYVVRVFQWKTSELNDLLQQFLCTCYDMLNGKADINKFSQDLCSALEWVINHCYSLQDVSSLRGALKKHHDPAETRSESETEIGGIGEASEGDKICLQKEQLSGLLMVADSSGQDDLLCHANKLPSPKERKVKLSDSEVSEKDLEAACTSISSNSECLINQLHESKRTVADLQKELEVLRQSDSAVKDAVQNQDQLNACLEQRIATVKVESSEAAKKLSPVGARSKNEYPHPNDSDSTCDQPPKEPQREIRPETSNDQHKPEEQQPIRTDWEITAASEKLAECQETILHLGKQLKALTSSKESALSDNCTSNPVQNDGTAPTVVSPVEAPPKEFTSQRSSLLDQMMAEEDSEPEAPKCPPSNNKPTGAAVRPTFITNETIEALEKILLPDVGKRKKGVNSSAIVPRKKEGLKSLWKKLIWRRKKSNSKKLPIPVAS